MTKNLAASVRARLASQAKASGRPFQELLQFYGLERFLFRFSQSSYRDRFVLKGALMLRVWDAPVSRPTRDIDFLGFADNSLESLQEIVRAICNTTVEDDGVRFEAKTVAATRIKEDADYEGVRVKFDGFLEKARIPMQLDIAFGDVIHPEATEAEYPALLDMTAPKLRVYPMETVVAEKFQAMVFLGTVNSRMKDFYDIWLLSRQFPFDGSTLAEAMIKTFANRRTPVSSDPVAFTKAFTEADAPARQWRGFVKKGQFADAPTTLSAVATALRSFLLPVAEAIRANEPFDKRWNPPGPWA